MFCTETTESELQEIARQIMTVYDDDSSTTHTRGLTVADGDTGTAETKITGVSVASDGTSEVREKLEK